MQDIVKLGSSSSDGKNVCVHGKPAGPWCRGLVWGIYLDGGDGHGGGGCGFRIHSNVFDASTAGALMVNGGGNVNFTNVRSLRHPVHAPLYPVPLPSEHRDR